MVKLTISIPDHVYRDARIRAAERNTSVDALVVEFLGSLSRPDDEFELLLARQEAALVEVEEFRGEDRLDRDALHGRGTG